MLHQDAAPGRCTRTLHQEAAPGCCTRTLHQDAGLGGNRQTHFPSVLRPITHVANLKAKLVMLVKFWKNVNGQCSDS